MGRGEKWLPQRIKTRAKLIEPKMPDTDESGCLTWGTGTSKTICLLEHADGYKDETHNGRLKHPMAPTENFVWTS